MGYEHRACKAVCETCGHGYWWRWQSELRRLPPTEWVCENCETKHFFRRLPQWPDLPTALYIGHEKNNQMKVYSIPPDVSEGPLAHPYSTRSFMSQASRRLGGCAFSTRVTGSVMGQPAFSDRCLTVFDDETEHECHMLAGFSIGQMTCALWEEVVAKLCQTDSERRFLRWYLELVKDRQFPMLIPQARVGIAERRRPDFVAFVPVHYWMYKRYAIQLDAAHNADQTVADRIRDEEVAVQGYEVISLRPSREGYLPEVKRLLEQIERDITKVDADAEVWSVALQLQVARTQSNAVPF